MVLLFKSTVGRKIVMAVTGLVMIGFVMGHLLGNATIFTGYEGINAYAEKLRSLGPLLWIIRLIMLVMVSLHVFFGISTSLENSAAKPDSYAVRKNRRSTFASRTMIWTGLVIIVYIIYHLLHFTFHLVSPEIAANRYLDAMGRPDIFSMVILGFQNLFASSFYITAMVAVSLHMAHGIQSLFQTLGLNNERSLPVIQKTGVIAAIILYLGYVSIPVAILAGMLKK